MSGRGLAVFILVSSVFTLAPGAYALSFSFSDQDYLGGASWGTMTIDAYDSDTLMVQYGAASSAVIPSGSQVTGFGFVFDVLPSGVGNPAGDVFTDDRDDLNWIVFNDPHTIPTPANRDEFTPPLENDPFTFGVTEGKANNFSPPGILPGESDVFYLDFAGVDFTSIALEEFVELTGIRLQSLPNDINEGSLFLAGNGDGDGAPVPEPGTLFLLGSGLIGIAALRRRTQG